MSDLPIVMTAAGPQPQSPAVLRALIVALATQYSAGITSNLPGTLIEDVTSTDAATLVLSGQAATDLVNSVTPFGANEFLLNQLGQIYGTPYGGSSNATVSVVFSGPPDGSTNGYPIPVGFLVSDGTYQYAVQDGGIIQSNGQSGNVSCVALQGGTWAIPATSVDQLVTPLPPGILLTVTNPQAGVPGQPAESWTQYRTEVMAAGLASAQGTPRFLKTQLRNVPGVDQRLIAVQQQVGVGWKVIVGGGDQYAVGSAIFAGVADPSTLVGSTIHVLGITQANPGVVTTDLNHGYADGQAVVMYGVEGMTQVNGVQYVATVLSEKQFALNTSTTGFDPYKTGGYVTPNLRNVTVPINDYPDVYQIPFVLPPLQTVTVVVTWNTTQPNFVASAAVAQLGGAAVIQYVNAITVGQPINLIEMETAFRNAVQTVLPAPLLTRLVFNVSINGVGTLPVPGSQIVDGDPESYFYAGPTSVVVNQG